MRRLVVLFFVCILSVSCFAEVRWLKAYQYAFANVINGTHVWGEWQPSSIKICFNSDERVVVVYSPRVQIYRIYDLYNDGNEFADANGGTNVMMYVVDQDNDLGRVKFRIGPSGESQVYIHFANMAWVYNVVRLE